MPNRILKESICSSDTINAMSQFEEIIFYRLIVNCDDYGRMDGRLLILKSKLFPLKERIANKDIESALYKLADIGCVKLYEVEKKPYLCLPTWEVHQTIRAKKSKYPSPDEGKVITHENMCKQMQADASKCPRNPIQSNPNLNTNSAEEKDCESVFEELWVLYPNKKGKGQVSNSAMQRICDVGLEEMKRVIGRYTNDLAKEEWRKAQNGSTFFNSGYVDYLDQNYISSGKIKPKKQQNAFNNFPQREYAQEEMKSMEEQLLGK